MNTISLIAAMVVATYSTRIAGFAFRGRSMPERVDRFLLGVPVAAFAALVATGLDLGSPGSDIRVLVAIPAGIVAFYWKKLWLTLLVGMALFWSASYLLG